MWSSSRVYIKRSHIPAKAGRATQISLALFFLMSCGLQKENNSLSKIEILYTRAWYMSTTPPLSCDKLLKGDFPYEKVLIENPEELKKWEDLLQSARLQELEGQFGDCRICCLMYSKQNQITTKVSIWPTGVQLNDKVYMFDSSYVNLVKQFLPKDYFPLRD